MLQINRDVLENIPLLMAKNKKEETEKGKLLARQKRGK